MNVYLCPIIEDDELSIQLVKANSKPEALHKFAMECLNEDEKRELLAESRDLDAIYNLASTWFSEEQEHLEESKDYNDDDEPSLDRVLEYLREERLIQIGEMYDIDYWDYQINNIPTDEKIYL